jgi:hypothetical protein
MKEKALIFIGFRHKKGSILTAKKEGYKTILLTRKLIKEAKPLFDLIIEDNILDPEVITKKIIPKIKERYSIKGIISNYEHYVVARSYLADFFQRPCTTVYGACCTRNKAMQRHALKFMKENIEYRIIKTESQAKKALKALGGNAYLKAIAGIKSRFIFNTKSEKEISKAFKKIKSKSKELDEDLYDDYKYCNFPFEYPNPKESFLVEKNEEGQQITISSLASNNQIWHAPSACDIYTASHINRKDTFLAFRILPSKFPKEIIKRAKTTTETATKILGIQYCSIFCEMIVNKKNEIKLIEIASRMGGYRPQMYETAYEIDINKLLVKSIIGKKITTRKKKKQYVSMVEIFAKKEGKLIKIDSPQDFKKDKNIKELEVLVKKGEKTGFAKNNFTPVLRFMIIGKTYNEVYEKSLKYHKTIKITVK